ncbi:MAG: BlaI/MecI/CopY family transcriptional regulator [Anaerolineae bacterium]
MTRKQGIQAFKLDQRGLARVFGELEAQIMDVIWKLGEPTVGDVCACLGEDYNYKTIMTVMNRLVDKGILSRRRIGRAYSYVPCDSRDAFLARVSRNVMEGLLKDFGDLAIAQFVSAVDRIDPAQLAELQQLIAARMNEENR